MRLSIITINYNNKVGFKLTLESVLQQSLSMVFTGKIMFEHVIVDGGSNDGSVDVIEEYVKKVGYPVSWISEEDAGIYNAMNKGTIMARGDYLLFLNSGDTLSDNKVLENLFSQNYEADIVIGRVNIVSGTKIVGANHTIFGKEIGMFGLLLQGIPHQGTLIRRELQEKNLYDEHYKINSDFKFFLETIVFQNCSVQYIPLTISNYDDDGISSRNPQLQIQERYEIFRQRVPSRIGMEYEFWIPYYYDLIRLKWLIDHPFFYCVYRAWTTLGRYIMGG